MLIESLDSEIELSNNCIINISNNDKIFKQKNILNNDVSIDETLFENIANDCNLIVKKSKINNDNHIFLKKIHNLYDIINQIAKSMLHTLLLSVFETIFFWIYVTKQEKSALLDKITKIRNIMEIICSQITESSIHNIINKYQEDSTHIRKQSNKIPFDTSLYLNFFLLFFTIIFYFFDYKLKNILKSEINKKLTLNTSTVITDLRNCIPLIIMISMYETIFFQLVVRIYQPMSTNEFIIEILKSCV